MFISKKRWEELEKKVADLEKKVQDQPLEIISTLCVLRDKQMRKTNRHQPRSK